jgi:hypothetical protein
MTAVTTTNIEYIDGGGADGSNFGHSATSLLGFFGTTPVVQQTAGTAAPAIDPAVSGSTLVASLQSIAIGAASLANANRTALVNLGLIA